MSYNQRCSIQTCSQGCCTSAGICPDPTSTRSSRRNCRYYYQTTELLGGGAIAGIAVGSFVLLVLVVLAIVCAIRRARQQAELNTVTAQVDNVQITDGRSGLYGEQSNQTVLPNSHHQLQPQGQIYPPVTPYQFGQPVYGQPVYSQQPPAYQVNPSVNANFYGPSPIVG